MECGFLGLSHLGLVYSTISAQIGWKVVQVELDVGRRSRLELSGPDVFEPELLEIWEATRALRCLTSEPERLSECDLVIIAPDVKTSPDGESDLTEVGRLLNTAIAHTHRTTPIVVLSQVPPGFTRKVSIQRPNVFYQVETLIFGEAVQRALHPERLIVGTPDGLPGLPESYWTWLKAFQSKIHIMRFESAELAKISINLMLAATLSTTNSIAELSESIGADWSEIVPALREDRRIGEFAYLLPGLGISGGNIERDLDTFSKLAKKHSARSAVIDSFITHSNHRKRFVIEQLNSRLSRRDSTVGLLGIAYKPGTSSTKNSPTLLTVAELGNQKFVVHDPVVRFDPPRPNVRQVESVAKLLGETDSLAIMTPWSEYLEELEFNRDLVINGKEFVIDPFGLLPTSFFSGSKCEHVVLGRGVLS